MSLITRTLYYPLKLSLEFYICDAATEKRKYDNIHALPNGLLNFVAYQREERCEGRKQRKTKFRIVKVKWAVTQNIMHQKREEGEKIRGIFFLVSLLPNHLIIKIGVAIRNMYAILFIPLTLTNNKREEFEFVCFWASHQTSTDQNESPNTPKNI